MENQTLFDMTMDELYHSGIKGMKWGVRRYQNKDGSLTPAGRKRYAKEMEKLKAEEKKIKNQQRTKAKIDKLDAKRKEVDNLKKASSGKTADQTAKPTPAKKSLKDMSNEEILKAMERGRLEQQYRQMFPEQVPKGKQIADTVINKMLVPALTEAGKKAASNALNNLVDRAFKEAEDPDSVSALTKQRDKLKLKNEITKLKKGSGTDDYDLTWDEKIKKQTYEKNKLDKEYDDLKRAHNIEQEKANHEKWKAKQESNQKTDEKPNESSVNEGKDTVKEQAKHVVSELLTKDGEVINRGKDYVAELQKYW